MQNQQRRYDFRSTQKAQRFAYIFVACLCITIAATCVYFVKVTTIYAALPETETPTFTQLPLTREEQVDLMAVCLEDSVHAVRKSNKGVYIKWDAITPLAAAFFRYRTSPK